MEELCRILVVEDEYITRQGIRNMIDWSAEGFALVGEACNGQDALEMIPKCQPQIVLTDVVMPILNGITLEEKLHAQYPQIQVVVLSSYSNFEYVRNSFQNGAADYILKPTLDPAKLLATLKRAAARIPGMVLRGRRDWSLARGVEQMLSGFAGQAVPQQVAQAFAKPNFQLVGMELSVFGQDAEAADKQKKRFAQVLQGSLRGFSGVHLLVDEAVLLLVLNFDFSEAAGLHHALRQTASALKAEEPRTFLVCSSCFQQISQMRNIYQGVFLQRLNLYFYYREESLMEEEAFPKETVPVKFHSAQYAALLQRLQMEQALQLLETSVQSALQARSVSAVELKALVQNAWYQLFSVMEDQGLNADDLSYLKRECLLKLYACTYADDFWKTFCLFQTDFRTLIQKYQIDAQNSMMQRILEYIDTHSAQPLTLHSLAEQFHFSYSYLSTYFRTHHSEGFSEYLNRERIRHATVLLQQGECSVSAVCEAVGYTDQSYFTRVFKKTVGCTPRDYRKRCGKVRN